MATLNLSNDEITELLVVLNNALAEVNEQLSHEYVIPLAREAAEARRDTIRKWIHRLSQQVGSEEERTMVEQEHRWTQVELAGIFEMSVIGDLERLIAAPGRRHRSEFANSYAINALQNLADSEILPDEI